MLDYNEDPVFIIEMKIRHLWIGSGSHLRTEF